MISPPACTPKTALFRAKTAERSPSMSTKYKLSAITVAAIVFNSTLLIALLGMLTLAASQIAIPL